MKGGVKDGKISTTSLDGAPTDAEAVVDGELFTLKHLRPRISISKHVCLAPFLDAITQ